VRRSNRTVLVIILGFGLLTQFNNCGSAVAPESDSAFSVTCDANGCGSTPTERLEIDVLPRLSVSAAALTSDIGGNCNDGGLPLNKITWQVSVNGQAVANCDQYNTCSQCIKGRFQAYVNFAGHSPSAGMQIQVTIMGFQNNVMVINPNTSISSKTIIVQPL
jgi:hypothetical protein